MWLYCGVEFTEDMIGNNVGFVYLITNITTGKQYIGKKLFVKSKRYQKNKKTKRKFVSSDWVQYTGSNDQLNKDIQRGDTIEKQILHLCKTRGWCSYWETKEIMIRDCILDENYYNCWLSARIRTTHLK